MCSFSTPSKVPWWPHVPLDLRDAPTYAQGKCAEREQLKPTACLAVTIMRIPPSVEQFFAAKRSGASLIVLWLGLLAWPVSFTAGGIHHHFAFSWQPYLNYFEWFAAAFGLACCIVASFLPKIPIVHRIAFLVVALLVYGIDLLLSTFASMFLFGFDN